MLFPFWRPATDAMTHKQIRPNVKLDLSMGVTETFDLEVFSSQKFLKAQLCQSYILPIKIV
jgi:hypothetical protein